MSDHRCGPRVVNKLFPLFEELLPNEQAIFERLMGEPVPKGIAAPDAAHLAEEVEEAKAHFRTKLQAMRQQP